MTTLIASPLFELIEKRVSFFFFFSSHEAAVGSILFFPPSGQRVMLSCESCLLPCLWLLVSGQTRELCSEYIKNVDCQNTHLEYDVPEAHLSQYFSFH